MSIDALHTFESPAGSSEPDVSTSTPGAAAWLKDLQRAGERGDAKHVVDALDSPSGAKPLGELLATPQGRDQLTALVAELGGDASSASVDAIAARIDAIGSLHLSPPEAARQVARLVRSVSAEAERREHRRSESWAAFESPAALQAWVLLIDQMRETQDGVPIYAYLDVAHGWTSAAVRKPKRDASGIELCKAPAGQEPTPSCPAERSADAHAKTASQTDPARLPRRRGPIA